MRKFWFIIQDELAKEGSGLARIKEKIQYIKRIQNTTIIQLILPVSI